MARRQLRGKLPRSGNRIGKSVLDVNTAGDTLSFSLGRDRQIAVQRTKEHEYTSRKLMGAMQTQTIGWKISVRNNRPQAVDLTLYDQLPVSANSSITVTAEEVSGGKVDGDTGIVMLFPKFRKKFIFVSL